MLKKSIHGFFNRGLAEVNSSKPHKLRGLGSLAIWESVHGLPRRAFFNTLRGPESSILESSLTPFSGLPYNPAR